MPEIKLPESSGRRFRKSKLLNIVVDNENPMNSYVIHPGTSGLNFFLRILPEVVYKLNCVVARNAYWFTMATLSDRIDSQMTLRIIRESKMATVVKNLFRSRAESYFDSNISSTGVLPNSREDLRKYGLFDYFKLWFETSAVYSWWKASPMRKGS